MTWFPTTVGVYVKVRVAEPIGRLITVGENVPARLLNRVIVVGVVTPLELIVKDPLAVFIDPDNVAGEVTE
jgi:RPA family protein